MSEPYWVSGDGDVTLHLGDCLAVLATMGGASVDAVVCDPPYGLEFMGREWDGSDGFRRSLNEADAGRDSVFGRTSRTSPEYRTGKPSGARIRPPSEADQSSGRAHNATTSLVARNAPEAYVAGHLFQEWCEAWARECLRVLKPGGYLLAFGGTRTWHRLVCGIEDAGFEIRDSVADLTGIDGPGLLWAYGSGFPKSLDVSKAIDKHLGAARPVVETIPDRWAGKGDVLQRATQEARGEAHITSSATAAAAAAEGWGTALKPAWEPVAVARKPLAGTVARNVLEFGTGALNIDGCRVAAKPGDYSHPGNDNRAKTGMYNHFEREGRQAPPHDAGRWPPNVVLGEDAAAEMDRQSGVLTSGANPTRRNSDKFSDVYREYASQQECTPHRGADSGGASRFFPVFRYEAKAAAHERPRLKDGTAHPTVKPVDLMAWLVRLVTPPGGLVLDPFAGSGATAEACVVEGFRCVLIEKEPSSAELIRTRLSKPIQPVMFT